MTKQVELYLERRERGRLEQVYLVGQQIVVMLVIAAIGYFLAKKDIVTDKVRQSLTTILLQVVTPCLFLNSMQSEFDPGMLHDLMYSVMLALIAFAVTILVARYLFYPGQWTIQKAIDRCCVVYSNAGFIGIPLVVAGWGNQGVMLATGYILSFNLISWTHGITEIGRGKGLGMITLKQLLTTPIYWAMALGVPMYIFSIRLPGPLAIACEYLADLNTGVAMLVLGGFLASAGLRNLFCEKKVYCLSMIRLLGFPLFLVLLYWVCGLHKLAPGGMDVMLIHIVQMSAPTAFMIAMFAERVGEDPTFATKVIAVSSILSVATVPLVMWLSQMLFQVQLW